MKHLIADIIMAAAGTAACTQDMTRDQLNPQRPQTMQERPQSVTPSARMNDSSRSGMQPGSSDSGTLMQQREQGMSSGTSQAPSHGNDATGKISQ